MACADRELGLLVVGFGDDVEGPEVFQVSHVVTYQVERDMYFESYLRIVAEDFWKSHVVPRVRPTMKPLGKKKAA
jgi:hypothetical protein